MRKEQFGLIGASLVHSLSAEIHPRLGKYPYSLWPMEQADVASFLESDDWQGMNVTMPYKRYVLPFLDEIDPAAQAIGAVNTIVRRGTKKVGYNTDAPGFAALLDDLEIDVAQKKVLILGTGGTAETALAVLCKRGALPSLVSRHPRPFQMPDGTAVPVLSYDAIDPEAALLVNTTPLGMQPAFLGASPLSLDRLPRLEGVIDVLYTPLRTPLCLDAEKRGIPAIGGLKMLVLQAEYAAALFEHRSVDLDNAERVYTDLVGAKRNVVLIGMPGVGKSTVGRLLAREMGRPLIDIDWSIIRQAGRSISEIFRDEGEAHFRGLEKEAVRAASLRTGVVIATGGGSVLDPENVRLLAGNGRLYWIDRPLEAIRIGRHRPLARSPEDLKRLQQERHALYAAAADVRIVPQTSRDAAGFILQDREQRQEASYAHQD